MSLRYIFLLCLILGPACDRAPAEAPVPPDNIPSAPPTKTTSAPPPAAHDHDAMLHKDMPAGEPTGGSLYQLTVPMTDQEGIARTWSDFKGTPVLVAIVYTSCTTACPMIVSEIKTIREEAGVETPVLLVSMDPDNDDQEALAALHERRDLDDKWTVARTSADHVRQLAAALGVRYRQLPDGSFNHSQVITLLDAEGTISARSEGLGPQRGDVVKALTGR